VKQQMLCVIHLASVTLTKRLKKVKIVNDCIDLEAFKKKEIFVLAPHVLFIA
jgi:hypothetical protein